MDPETENEEHDVKSDTERVLSADPSTEELSTVTLNGHEGVPAEEAGSDHDEGTSGSVKAIGENPVEEAATSEQQENSGDEITGVQDITTSEDLPVNVNEVSEQPVSREGSVVFEINSGGGGGDDDDDDGPTRLHLETPERESTSPTQEEGADAEEEEPTAAPSDKEDIDYAEYSQLLRELREERDRASQHSNQLQMKLAEYLHKKAGDDGQLERELPEAERLREYEKHVKILTDLKQQLAAESEAAQQQAQELSLQSQEKQDKVENEWRAFTSLKQDVAATVLSQRLGKQAAQAKVESTLAAEQLRQDELIKLRLKHIGLSIRIQRLEAELRVGEERDPLQLQFEQLQAERLELKKQAEKQNEESMKMRKKISSSLELLSNIKEKLFCSQIEVQAKREQLAEVETVVARKRGLLTRTKQARNRLQRDNLRLKEHRGLLGNRVLLQDFEKTINATEHLENLKGRQAEIVFSCGRWKTA